MKEKLFRPIMFNVIAIVAMLFTLFLPVSHNIATSGTIDLIEDAIGESDLTAQLEAERQFRLQLTHYILYALIIAILANVVASYFGRRRYHKYTARIGELEADMRKLKGR